MKCIRVVLLVLLLLIASNTLLLHIGRSHIRHTSSTSDTVRPVSDNRGTNDKMTSVCMMVPVVSRRNINDDGTIGLTVTDLHLISVFLPSFFNTTEPNYRYTVYIGYDYGDKW
jgi:hypothetical protein